MWYASLHIVRFMINRYSESTFLMFKFQSFLTKNLQYNDQYKRQYKKKKVTWDKGQGWFTVLQTHLIYCLIFMTILFTQDNSIKKWVTSTDKSIGGNGGGGESSDSCHYCSHGNNQTGESCRRKHTITVI